MMANWEGEYRAVRWRPLSIVFTEKPPADCILVSNSAPIPMSYGPKLDAVFEGRCRQTIRKGDKYEVGQRRWIFEWSGRPYRSKWGRRMLVEIVKVCRLGLTEDAVAFNWADSTNMFECSWSSPPADDLAAIAEKAHKIIADADELGITLDEAEVLAIIRDANVNSKRLSEGVRRRKAQLAEANETIERLRGEMADLKAKLAEDGKANTELKEDAK